MVKITVLVPVELEVNVTQFGELTIGGNSCLPTWGDIRKALSKEVEVIPESAFDYEEPGTNAQFVGNYAIVSR